jgi:hypothetical protein
MQDQENEFEVAIVISNARNSSFPLVLEPWGMPYEMPAQARYTVVFRSLVPPAPPNTVEVEHAADSITVWAWDGCLYAVYSNGEVLPPGAFEGPRLPAGAAIIKDAILKPLGRSSTNPDANPTKEPQDENRNSGE